MRYVSTIASSYFSLGNLFKAVRHMCYSYPGAQKAIALQFQMRRSSLESDRKIARIDLRIFPRTEQVVSIVALIIFFASGFSALLY